MLQNSEKQKEQQSEEGQQQIKVENKIQKVIYQAENTNCDSQISMDSSKQSLKTVKYSNETDLRMTDNSAQLFVYNLSSNVTEGQLKQLFCKAGSVISIQLPLSGQINRGFAFITLENSEQAQIAFKTINKEWLNWKEISIIILQKNPTFESIQSSDVLTFDQIFKQNINDQTEMLKQLFLKYQNVNEFNLLLILDCETLTSIQQRLNNMDTAIEFALLDILELVSYRISKMPMNLDKYTESCQSLIYEDFRSSMIIKKIKEFLNQSIKIKENIEINNRSTLLQQLVRIYLFIMTGKQIENEMLEICAQVLSQYFSAQIECFKINQKDNNINKDEDIQNKIQLIAQSLEAINSTIEYNKNNRKHLANQLQLYKNISPLIHLNCAEINCQQNINVRITYQQQSLFVVLYKLLYYLSSSNNEVNDYLLKAHNFLPHLAQIIINFTYTTSQPKQLINNEQILQSQSSETFTLSAVNLLYNLIHNNSQRCQQTSTAPKLIKILISHSIYKTDKCIIEDEEKKDLLIRIQSGLCLREIRRFGLLITQTQLLDNGYVRALSINVSTSRSEEYSEQVGNALFDLEKIFSLLLNGSEQIPQILQISPQPVLAKKSYEQFEQEGANEEIEAQQFKTGQLKIIKRNFLSTRDSIMNLFINVTNRRRRR